MKPTAASEDDKLSVKRVWAGVALKVPPSTKQANTEPRSVTKIDHVAAGHSRKARKANWLDAEGWFSAM
jgi:hypothetical protein